MKSFHEFSLVWAVASILLCVGGVFLWSASPLIDNKTIGMYTLSAGIISFCLFLIVSFVGLFSSNKYTAKHLFFTLWKTIAVLLILSGIGGAMLLRNSSVGLNLLFGGLGLAILYFFKILLSNILKKEE